MAAFLRTLDRGLQIFLRWFCTLIFIVLALILLLNVFLRVGNDLANYLVQHGQTGLSDAVRSFLGLLPIQSMHWLDEIVELCFASLVFYGAAALWGLKGHFCVGDWISPRLVNARLRAVYKLLVTLVSVAFLAVFFWFSLSLVRRTTELSTVFQIPKTLIYSCMPISSAIMLCYSLVDVFLDVKELIAPASGGSGEREAQSM